MITEYIKLAVLCVGCLIIGAILRSRDTNRYLFRRIELPMTADKYREGVRMVEFRHACPHAARIIGADERTGEGETATIPESFAEFIAGLDLSGLEEGSRDA